MQDTQSRMPTTFRFHRTCPVLRNNVSQPAASGYKSSGYPRRLVVPGRLDAIDWKILAELQDNGRITNVELARRVGISAPPCLRRVRALEEAGFIKGYRALLDEKRLGYEVTVFAMVHLSSQADADLKAFEDFVRAEPLVRECWMLSGEIDFVLKCVAPNLSTFQDFVARLTAEPHVRNVKTSLTLRNSKDDAMVPLEAKESTELRGARLGHHSLAVVAVQEGTHDHPRRTCGSPGEHGFQLAREPLGAGATALAGANAGMTSAVNRASERSDSSTVMSPKANHERM